MKRDFSHLPAWVERSAAGTWRARANMSAIACSAVVTELPWGVFITTIPRWVAAATSTLSTPIPARPTTFSRSALAITWAVTLVAERMASPSYCAIVASSSDGGSPVRTSAAIPRALKISTARGLSSSAISTRYMTLLACGIGPRDQKTPRRASAKAQSSQGKSASRSAVSTVAPAQILRPGGASR